MSEHTDCYIYKCPHKLPNGKCKFGWRLMSNRCPAPLAAGIKKEVNLETKIEKGDLVEVKALAWNHLDAPTHLTQGIVQGTEKDPGMILGHINVKNHVIPISNVTKVIQKQAIPKKLFKYLEGSLYLTEPPGHDR